MRHAAQQAPGKARNDVPVHRPADPRPVWVWLVMRELGDYRAKGEAIGWTTDPDCRQVWVRYRDEHGREGFVWVWADAVKPR